MCSQNEVCRIIHEMNEQIGALYPLETPDVILFCSYARHQEQEDSDIDVLYLVDASRQEIAERSWRVGAAAADLLMEHGVVISPLIENRACFHSHANVLPFFRTIQMEGVRMHA